MDWFYSQMVGFLGAFFAQMGNMGVELFDLSWVQSVVRFFSQLGWALFAVSVVVSAFECGIEYASGRGWSDEGWSVGGGPATRGSTAAAAARPDRAARTSHSGMGGTSALSSSYLYGDQ